MAAQIPRSKPQASFELVATQAAKAFEVARPGKTLPAVYVLAVRAYYRDSMGKVGENDPGMYDDAFFIVTPYGFYPYNGNTDPSRYGWNDGAGKYMARLKPGVYDFRRLKHKINSPSGYMAFGQGPVNVTVERVDKDGKVRVTESGIFGINNHRGGNSGTSSEGCLTVPVDQWPGYEKTLRDALVTAGQATFPFILIEGPIN